MSFQRLFQIILVSGFLLILAQETAVAQKPTAAIAVDALQNVRLAYLKKIFVSIVFKPETDAYFNFDPKFWTEFKSTLQKAQLTVVDEEKAEDAALKVEGFLSSSKDDKVLVLHLSLEKEFPARVGTSVLSLPAQVWFRQAIIFDPDQNKAQVMAEIRRMLNEFLTDRYAGGKIRKEISGTPKKPAKK